MTTAGTQTTDLSDPTPAPRRRLAGFALWTAVTLIYALTLHLEKVRLPFGEALRQAAVFYCSLALVMAGVGRWSDRFMARPRRPVVIIPAELGVGILALGLWQGLVWLVNWYRMGPYVGRAYSNWMFQGLFDVAIYGSARGLMLVAQSWRDQRERERREASLVVAAREAELSALKSQFQPHFVLNALTSVLALIDHDPALARTMVVRLSDLMKAVFDRADVREVPLERELDLARAYLDVERIRLGARLSVRFEVEDAARGVMVPPFLLQPLVENAVKHGVAPFAGPGLVRVAARLAGDRVHLTVHDSGTAAAWAGPAPPSTGHGLQITRRRRETVYGDSFVLTFDHRAVGTSVHLDLPADMSRVA
jgi:two-component system LytT family sensor kinase